MLDPKSDLLLPPGYALDEVLGNRGQVWVLRAQADGRTVVLRLDSGGETREGLAELAVLSAVDHPGVAGLTDYGTLADGTRYLARRWIDGQDLLGWARGRSHEEIGALVARLTPALDHLHRAGFVHADLKPENVIVTPEGRPILCDFGLSSRDGARQPDTGVSGTLFAIAPEVLMGMELTPSSDLFGLGAMLHRLLVGIRRSAREFYALFPDRSYLDAAGSDPEDLPAWSRDLIVSLTARDPSRRPRSAAAVGRLLAERLGVALDTKELVDDLRWPVAFGRDSWISDWLATTAESEAPLWVRVPEGEDPRPLWEHLRLYASLRGRAVRGLDLSTVLGTIQDGVALDEWSAGLVEGASGWIGVLAPELDAWQRRALESLERATALERRKHAGGLRLFVVSAREPSTAAYQARPVPASSEELILRFLERPLAAESSVRRGALAARLAAGARGSATRLDRMLGVAQQKGWLFAQDQGYRLRPGELPDPAVLSGSEAADDELGLLEKSELELLSALQACGGRAPTEELAALVDLGPRAFGANALSLRRAGWIDAERGSMRLARLPRRPVLGIDALRALHERRARALERASPTDNQDKTDARIALHRFCALPLERTARALGQSLAALRERGRAEAALELLDQAREAAQALGIDLTRTASELAIERARAWCSLGQTEPALREIEGLSASSNPRLVAWVELVRAEVARLRHETDQAFVHYDHAAELDASVRIEAAIGRLLLLHAGGKDEETCAALQRLAPRELEQRGELEARRRAYLESVAAMSVYRLGRVDEARAAQQALIAEFAAAKDPALLALLRINLAIIERGSGSLERAKHELEQACELYDEAGLIAGLAHARTNLGGLLRELGELIAAEPLLVSAMEIRERLDDREGSSTVRGMLGLLHFERGHARATIETLESTAEGMTGAQKRRYAPLLAAKAGEMRARLGDTSRAEAIAVDQDGIDPRILLARAHRVAARRARQGAGAGRALGCTGAIPQAAAPRARGPGAGDAHRRRHDAAREGRDAERLRRGDLRSAAFRALRREARADAGRGAHAPRTRR
ncbi:MAG: serine/threonine-protein kinase, partial [Planctomycetota bacterium]